MKDEIKEILSNDNIHIIECEKNWCNAYGYEKSQMKSDVIKYITILEEKNQRLNNIIDELEKESHLGMLENQNNNDYAKGLYCAYEYINQKIIKLKEGKE